MVPNDALRGRKILVTGAARGIGSALARRLHERGARVALAGLEPDQLEATASELDAPWWYCDVSDRSLVDDVVDDAARALGGLDVVVANAGVVAMGKPDPGDAQLYRDIVDTNLNGVWHTIASTVPSIIRKGRGGSIILVSSMQGLVGRGGDGSAAAFAYAASKHGVVGLMRSAANAYAAQNIRVNSVHPTGVGTPMIFNEHMAQVFANNPEDLGAMTGNLLPVPFVDPVDVTNVVTFLASEKARYITGVTMPVDAGYGVM